jgi:hypothetical protein
MKMSRLRTTTLAALLGAISFGIAVQAADRGTPYQMLAGAADHDDPMIVAGYRAIFTCSAHFLMNRPLDDIKRVELVDVEGRGFPDPVIDEKRQLVIAKDPSGKFTRIAAFRDSMGCTVLPPHWTESDVPRLPYVSYAPAPDLSKVPFPEGDKSPLPPSGLDRRFENLEPVLERAFDGVSHAKKPGTVTTSVLVIKLRPNGEQLIAERYRPGFGIFSGYRTWSTTKSITAALMGIASRQGLVTLDAPVAVPEWPEGDARRAITYQQLILRWTGCDQRSDRHLTGSRTWHALEIREQ